MSIHIICWGGMPATGKSALMFRVMKMLGEHQFVSLSRGIVSGSGSVKHRVMVLGCYNAHDTTPGTDRLSMAVQPEVVKMLGAMNKSLEWDGWTVLFEGDRLFNGSFFEHLIEMQIPYRCFMLTARPEVLLQRHVDRRDAQSAMWLKGRKTKLDRLAAAYDLQCYPNETAEQLEANANTVLSEIEGKPR